MDSRMFAIRVLRRLRLLESLNLKFSLRGFRIPILGGVGEGNLKPSEPWMLDLLRRLNCESRFTFLDVGVNIGQTLLALQSLDKRPSYIGFEPNPVCVSYVMRLVELNGFRDVSVICGGISQQSGMGSLYLTPGDYTDSTASTIANFKGRHGRSMPVHLFGAKEVEDCLKGRTLAVLKVDVEGGELEVFQALEPQIQKDRPDVILEVLPNYGGRNKARLERQSALEKLLHSLGYSIFRIIKDQKGRLLELKPLKGFGVHSDLDCCDYLLQPQ